MRVAFSMTWLLVRIRPSAVDDESGSGAGWPPAACSPAPGRSSFRLTPTGHGRTPAGGRPKKRRKNSSPPKNSSPRRKNSSPRPKNSSIVSWALDCLGPDGDDHRRLRLGDVAERSRGQVATDWVRCSTPAARWPPARATGRKCDPDRGADQQGPPRRRPETKVVLDLDIVSFPPAGRMPANAGRPPRAVNRDASTGCGAAPGGAPRNCRKSRKKGRPGANPGAPKSRPRGGCVEHRSGGALDSACCSPVPMAIRRGLVASASGRRQLQHAVVVVGDHVVGIDVGRQRERPLETAVVELRDVPPGRSAPCAFARRRSSGCCRAGRCALPSGRCPAAPPGASNHRRSSRSRWQGPRPRPACPHARRPGSDRRRGPFCRCRLVSSSNGFQRVMLNIAVLLSDALARRRCADVHRPVVASVHVRLS